MEWMWICLPTMIILFVNSIAKRRYIDKMIANFKAEIKPLPSPNDRNYFMVWAFNDETRRALKILKSDKKYATDGQAILLGFLVIFLIIFLLQITFSM